MRISTSQIFQSGANSLMDGQSKLYKLQNQLSSGKKFLSAQDDPVAAAQVLLNSQALAVNSQYADNQANASSQLSLEESQLQSVVDNIQYVLGQVIAGGNGSYSDSQRQDIANDLKSQLDFLLGVANSTDASGYYLFSGYQGSTRPFQTSSDGSVSYVGDDGQRSLQVASSRQIPVSDSGRDIFANIRTGNGTFALGASSSNTGTGVIGSGSVVDPTAWSGHDYEVAFSSSTDYTVTDTKTGTVIGSYTYSAGGSITAISGVTFSIQGTPAAGDTFSVAASRNQSIFSTLQNLIDAFSTDIEGNAGARASLGNVMNTEMENLNRALDSVLSAQASVGSRLSELDSLGNVSDALELQYKSRLSDLQDIDYADVLSRFKQQQTQLEAAQASFAQTSALSLFDYL